MDCSVGVPVAVILFDKTNFISLFADGFLDVLLRGAESKTDFLEFVGNNSYLHALLFFGDGRDVVNKGVIVERVPVLFDESALFTGVNLYEYNLVH